MGWLVPGYSLHTLCHSWGTSPEASGGGSPREESSRSSDSGVSGNLHAATERERYLEAPHCRLSRSSSFHTRSAVTRDVWGVGCLGFWGSLAGHDLTLSGFPLFLLTALTSPLSTFLHPQTCPQHLQRLSSPLFPCKVTPLVPCLGRQEGTGTLSAGYSRPPCSSDGHHGAPSYPMHVSRLIHIYLCIRSVGHSGNCQMKKLD